MVQERWRLLNAFDRSYFFWSSFVLVRSDPTHSEVEVSERQGRALRARIPGL
jgi:hypothetical protein